MCVCVGGWGVRCVCVYVHVGWFFTCWAIKTFLSKIILQITSMSMQNAVHNLPWCLV